MWVGSLYSEERQCTARCLQRVAPRKIGVYTLIYNRSILLGVILQWGRTPECRWATRWEQRAVHCLATTWVVTRNVKSNFFRAKTFNIFYIFGREKFSTSAIRAPIKPRKFPQKHLENPQKHLEFPTSDVFLPLKWGKKRGKNPVFRALSSSLVQR